ncbi:carbohydrate sulfotransferase 11-like isoform X1 [Branchiostoma floridae]|uniref:Carbohydrate sulfotransferase n=1 Tax=Branchiostoma floridae TaxID=7739 RepID=A0A9J7L3K1_BRAFL|nr:carbohydrate sulfotransferase 11-like isoform X1 [Branchiostoma floridae]
MQGGVLSHASRQVFATMRASRIFLGATVVVSVVFLTVTYLEGWFRVSSAVTRAPARTRFLFSAGLDRRTADRAQGTQAGTSAGSAGRRVQEDNAEKIQRDRKTALERVCNVSLPELVPPLSTRQLGHLIVDDEHKMLYCFVPKVACTNWKRVMIKLRHPDIDKPQDISPRDAHETYFLPTLKRYSPEAIQYRLDNYFKFMFVRDPLERLLSAYINKFTMPYNLKFHRLYGTKIISRFRENPSNDSVQRGDDVMFKEFVQYLLDPQAHGPQLNEHWDHYFNLCHPCRIHYDVIGKYETLDQDVNYVLQRAGVANIVQFPPKPKKAQTSTSQLLDEYLDEIGPKEVLRLHNMYILDYLMFNYSLPNFPGER